MRDHLVLALALGACFDPPAADDDPAIDSHIESYDVPGTISQQLDILFVIDNTAAMAAHRSKVLALATYVDATLNWPDGALPHSRVAVTTTDGTGELRQPAATSEPYLESGLDARLAPTANFEGTLRDALEPLLDVGAQATSAVTPLAAMQLALDANPEIMREYAYLGVVTIAASDDASPSAPLAYVDALKARKADPTAVLVSGIYDPLATRLGEFHDGFPNRNSIVDIATDDYSGAVTILSQLLRFTLGSACVLIPADVDLETPESQYDCALAAIYVDDTSEPLPQCTTDGPARCFEVVLDLQTCPDPEYGRLVIRGYPGYHRPGVRGQCVVN